MGRTPPGDLSERDLCALGFLCGHPLFFMPGGPTEGKISPSPKAKDPETAEIREDAEKGGLWIQVSGFRLLIPTSNLTWSLPFPVHPWAIASAPSLFAASTSFLTISGLASAVARK